MTLSALLTTVRKSLRSFGVVNPDVEAETIISHVLGLSRSEVYLEPDRPVAPASEARILDIVAERERRFPLQYLLGEIEFMGLPFKIRKGVFIPRPETEILVETVIGRTAGMTGGPAEGRSAGRRLRILDLATGSGVIAVSLAKYLPCDFVLATDLCSEAALLARENAETNSVGDAVTVAVGNGLDFIGTAGPAASATVGPAGGAGGARISAQGFDIVVSNPPYIPAGDIGGLQPEVRDYEPRLALDGGDDGLSLIAGVLPEIPSILKERGIVAFEIGAGQGDAVRDLFRRTGLEGVEVIKDLADRDRIVLGIGPGRPGDC